MNEEKKKTNDELKTAIDEVKTKLNLLETKTVTQSLIKKLKSTLIFSEDLPKIPEIEKVDKGKGTKVHVLQNKTNDLS